MISLDSLKMVAFAGTVIGAVLLWQWYVEGQREEARVQLRGEYAVQLAEATARALDLERAMNRLKDEAIRNAHEREKTIRALSAASAASTASLHDTITSLRNSLSGASLETAVKRADTFGKLLDQCQTEYRNMTERADRHASDAQTLSEAWPKSGNMPVSN